MQRQRKPSWFHGLKDVFLSWWPDDGVWRLGLFGLSSVWTVNCFRWMNYELWKETLGTSLILWVKRIWAFSIVQTTLNWSVNVCVIPRNCELFQVPQLRTGVCSPQPLHCHCRGSGDVSGWHRGCWTQGEWIGARFDTPPPPHTHTNNNNNKPTTVIDQKRFLWSICYIIESSRMVLLFHVLFVHEMLFVFGPRTAYFASAVDRAWCHY